MNDCARLTEKKGEGFNPQASPPLPRWAEALVCLRRRDTNKKKEEKDYSSWKTGGKKATTERRSRVLSDQFSCPALIYHTHVAENTIKLRKRGIMEDGGEKKNEAWHTHTHNPFGGRTLVYLGRVCLYVCLYVCMYENEKTSGQDKDVP